MRRSTRVLGMAVVILMSATWAGPTAATAQMAMPGPGRSLGGYGASTIGSYYSSGGGGYLPYNGRAGGFVPYRGGARGGLGAQPISRRLSQTSIGGATMASTPIGGASLAGGMGAGGIGGRGARAMGTPSSGRELVPFGYEGGLRMGGGMSGMPLTPTSRMRPTATGPGFGSPFRMPPSLSGGTSSMAMP